VHPSGGQKDVSRRVLDRDRREKVGGQIQGPDFCGKSKVSVFWYSEEIFYGILEELCHNTFRAIRAGTRINP